jgi:hypothetical protein
MGRMRLVPNFSKTLLQSIGSSPLLCVGLSHHVQLLPIIKLEIDRISRNDKQDQQNSFIKFGSNRKNHISIKIALKFVCKFIVLTFKRILLKLVYF